MIRKLVDLLKGVFKDKDPIDTPEFEIQRHGDRWIIIPVILCTGFSETVNKENFRALGIRGFVMKPIGRKIKEKVPGENVTVFVPQILK